MSQKELAEAACLTPASVSRYVNGEREPRALTVVALADVLGVKPSDIIGTSDEQGQACELDETYFPESFKGNHSKGSFTLPRKARHRGKQVHKRGLSREQICVMTGISDTNATFFEVSGRGVVSRKRAAEALRHRIGAGAVVATDKATAYIDVLCDLKVASHESYDSKDRSEGTINRINTVHSLLDSFMARFKGVSTKHLGAYLDWFRWCRTFMATDSRTAESTVARQLANGICATRIRDMFNVLPPYMDYWVSRAA